MKDSVRNIPECVGFIMDGNRRYAKEQGANSFEGHLLGKEKLKEVISWCKEAGIGHVVFYAFSTENWHRSKEEADALTSLFKITLDELENEISKAVYKLKFIGRRSDFGEEMSKQMSRLEESVNSIESDITVWFALSYGGRQEIVAGVNEAIRLGREVDETIFKNLLWTARLPDPDLIIRTGGEQRLSNFLTWGGVYSELYFSDTYWPAFTKDEFNSILIEYAERDRRRGK
jgi:undecaprenyl diphosphate synthase